MTNWEQGSITIRGQEIAIKTAMYDHVELKYFTDNPRIYSTVHEGGEQLDQAGIQQKLWKMDHVKELKSDIKSNGGLIDPVIVHAKTLEVIEGNSRLAAYRKLANDDPIKWGKMKCTFLPKEISESAIFALLGQYHIKGKKDWSPYEQAGFLFRRHTQHHISPSSLAKELGMTRASVKKLILVYKKMVENDDNDVTRWSYYYEFYASTKIGKLIEDHSGLEKTVLAQIKGGEIKQATVIRDQLSKIPRTKRKIVRDIIAGKSTIEEGFERAEASGSTNALYNKIKNFRAWYDSPETEQALKKTNAAAMKRVRYEVNKLGKATTRLKKIINDNVGDS